MKDIINIVLDLVYNWFGAVMGQGLIRKRILEILHYHFKLIIAPGRLDSFSRPAFLHFYLTKICTTMLAIATTDIP